VNSRKDWRLVMGKPFFVYTIYIASTPEKVSKALTGVTDRA